MRHLGRPGRFAPDEPAAQDDQIGADDPVRVRRRQGIAENQGGACGVGSAPNSMFRSFQSPGDMNSAG